MRSATDIPAPGVGEGDAAAALPLWTRSASESPVVAGSASVGGSSGATVVIAVLVALVLLGLRVPSTVAQLHAELPADIRADLGDPALETLAVGVGVGLGLLLTAFSFAVLVLVGRALERWTVPATRGLGPLRVGPFVGALVVVFSTYQICSVAWAGQSTSPVLLSAVAALVGTLSALVGFRGALRAAARPGVTVALLVAFSFVSTLSGVGA